MPRTCLSHSRIVAMGSLIFYSIFAFIALYTFRWLSSLLRTCSLFTRAGGIVLLSSIIVFFIVFIAITYFPVLCTPEIPETNSCINSANTQSLVQLAAALNAGYFAFQAANDAHYKRIEAALATLEESYSKLRITSTMARAMGPELLDYKNTCASRKRFYDRFNRVAIYVGYGNFIAMCLCLLLLTIIDRVPIWAIYTVFFVGYFPLAVAAILEMVFRLRFARVENGITDLRQRMADIS